VTSPSWPVGVPGAPVRSLPRGKSRAEGWPLQAESPLGVDRSECGYERRTSAGPAGAVGVHGLPRTDVGCPRRAEVRPVTYVITEPCVDVLDRACIEECPVDCIYAGRRTLYIHPGECVDCGACEPVCPSRRSSTKTTCPASGARTSGRTPNFFDDLGSPRGASKVGQLDRDVGPAATVARRRPPAE
jgi:NAD-dependent dihydropyrimidine dehydrogenase PreA subunit